MCNHDKISIIEQDEQPLFQVLYCEDCDLHYDGFGNYLELEKMELMN